MQPLARLAVAGLERDDGAKVAERRVEVCRLLGTPGAGGGGTKSWRDRVQPFVGDGQVSDGSLVVDVASLSLKVYQQKVEEDDK